MSDAGLIEKTGIEKTGGCQCGHVRYRVRLANEEAYLCHCRMCQRATGGFAASFFNVPQTQLIWESEPDWYQSSAIARRPFCHACGTPLGFQYLEGPNCDLTVGSLDDPQGMHPTSHFGIEHLIHEDWLDTHNLPKNRLDEYQPLLDRWAKAGIETP